jgi:hypothetical protein
MSDENEDDGSGSGLLYTVIGVVVFGLAFGWGHWSDQRASERCRQASYERFSALGGRQQVIDAVNRHHDDTIRKSRHGRRWWRRLNEEEYFRLMEGLVRNDLKAQRPAARYGRPAPAVAALT